MPLAFIDTQWLCIFITWMECKMSEFWDLWHLCSLKLSYTSEVEHFNVYIHALDYFCTYMHSVLTLTSIVQNLQWLSQNKGHICQYFIFAFNWELPSIKARQNQADNGLKTMGLNIYACICIYMHMSNLFCRKNKKKII